MGIVGAVALMVPLSETRAVRIAFWGLIAFIIGQVLNTAVFGVAAFFQPAIGDAFLDGQEAVARTVNEDVYGPALFATVGVGLLLWRFGLVQLGRAMRRSDQVPEWAGLTFAIAAPVFAIAGFTLEPLQPVAGFVLAASAAVAASGLSGRGQGPTADEPRPAEPSPS